MKCSATTKNGRPCPAPATRKSDPPRCPMHGDSALSYQRSGAWASRLRRAMPSTYEIPEFEDERDIVRFARELVRLALTEDVDPRRVDTAIRGAHLALAGFSAQTQARLVDALLKLEHGGAAVALLAQFTNDPTKRKPLPGRVLPMSAGGDGA